MKKFLQIFALVLVLAIPVSALAKTTYTPEKMRFVIVAQDSETNKTYTSVVVYKTVLRLAKENALYEVYQFENTSLIPIDFKIDDHGKVILLNRLTGENITE